MTNSTCQEVAASSAWPRQCRRHFLFPGGCVVIEERSTSVGHRVLMAGSLTAALSLERHSNGNTGNPELDRHLRFQCSRPISHLIYQSSKQVSVSPSCQPWTSTSRSTRLVLEDCRRLIAYLFPIKKIIKSKPRGRRGGRGGARPAATGTRARYATTIPKTVAPVVAAKAVGSEASKIIISNLPADVTEVAVRVSR
jgi:hypothetical protein